MNRLSLVFASIPLTVAAGGCFGDSSGPPATISLADAEADSACMPAEGVCEEPNIPVGCTLGPPPCVTDGTECPVVVCPDASAVPDAAIGTNRDAAIDAAPDAPVVAAPDAAIVDAALDAMVAALDAASMAAPDAAAMDAASAADAGGFTCDSGNGSPISCDGQTQICKLVFGGPAPGIHAPSCVAIPANCASAPTCSCLQTAFGSGNMCSEDAFGDFTLTQDVP